MKSVELEEFVSDLRGLASGHLGEGEFRARYMRVDGPGFLAHVWDGLEHFLADADIRAKDDGYREMQEEELGRLIDLLRAEAPAEQLRRITFLGPSKR
jgi:hypothetical protein